MKIAEEICRLRAAAGMSQEDLANRLEVSRQSVSKWETGASIPDIEKLVKMAELFGVTLDELVTGERPEPVETEPALTPAKIAGLGFWFLAGLCVAVTILFGNTFGIHTGEGLMLSLWFALLGAVAWNPQNDKLRINLGALCGAGAVVLVLLAVFRIRWFSGTGLFVLVCATLAAWTVWAKKCR